MFQKFWYRNFSCIGGGGGSSQFYRIFFVSQDRNEKRRKGTLLCFRKILVWKKKFMGKRGWGGGGLSRFPSKFFWLKVSKKIVGETFCVSKTFWYGKKFRDMRGVSRFSVEILLFHFFGKIRRGALLCFKKILVSKIFMHRRGGITVSSKYFCLTVPKRKTL